MEQGNKMPHTIRYFDEAWPESLDHRTICLTVDVEWAAPEVLDDLRRLFDDRGLKATFFCTHAGVDVGHHERGLHPNFRPTGDTIAQLRAAQGEQALLNDVELFRHVLGRTLSYAPEAKGVRSHSLHYDSLLMPIYCELGLEYDSTYLMPLVGGLRPFWKEYGVLEFPIWFNDHFELKSGATGFDHSRLSLQKPGLKVINMHPNMVFINAASDAHYLATKSFYRDAGRLLAARHAGTGIRTMVVDLLDAIAACGHPTATLGEVNRAWRDNSLRSEPE
jgi:peptidoglycan/xylan/chitin deacetylase (PgdA/CDA1 family)